MKFDKSKVCVAGLHEVKEGTMGWFADSVDALEEYVTQNSANLYLTKMKGQRDCLYVGDVNTVWRFFYPAPENKHRPFETMEEARGLMGKWVRSKDGKALKQVILIYYNDMTGVLFINTYSSYSLFEHFVIDETGEPVGVEV